MLGVGRPSLWAGVGTQERLLDQLGVQLGESGLDQPTATLQQDGLVDAGALVRGDRGARPAQDRHQDEGEEQPDGVDRQRRRPSTSALRWGRRFGRIRRRQDPCGAHGYSVEQLHFPVFGRDGVILTPSAACGVTVRLKFPGGSTVRKWPRPSPRPTTCRRRPPPSDLLKTGRWEECA